jgi:5-methylcytosine-specific restriction endonuclease McrA
MITNDTMIPDGYKMCSRCHKIKPSTTKFFSPKKEGLRAQCKSCHAEVNRDWYEAHKEQKNKSTMQWQKEHYEEVKERSRRWRENHRKHLRERDRRWRKKNLRKVRESHRKRRSHQIDLSFDFSPADETRALEYWHGYCAVCGEPLRDLFGERVLHFDHWIPISDQRPNNPGTVPENMVPLCSKCNLSKNDTDPVLWLERRYSKNKVQKILKAIHDFFEWTVKTRETDNKPKEKRGTDV